MFPMFLRNIAHRDPFSTRVNGYEIELEYICHSGMYAGDSPDHTLHARLKHYDAEGKARFHFWRPTRYVKWIATKRAIANHEGRHTPTQHFSRFLDWLA